MAQYKAPRGTHDIYGQLALALEELDKISRNVFRKHNFKEIKTPMFEDVALFTRSIGEATDIVEKEMYVLLNKAVVIDKTNQIVTLIRSYVNGDDEMFRCVVLQISSLWARLV